MTDSSSDQHVVLFPYMSKGHIIPLLQFARLFLHHQRLKEPTISVTITVFTTPKNQAFVNDFLPDTPEIEVISLPFPQSIPGIPTGVESTDTLPSISLYVPFTRATKLLQPFFEESLKNLPQVSFMVSDAFLWWTSESSAKFNIPRLVFYGMNNYSTAISISISISNSPFRHKLSTEIQSESETEPVFVPDFPWIQVTWNDFYHGTHTDPKESGPALELSNDQYMATETSHGFLVNSFYELESTFADYNNNISDRPKSWCVGPLCLTEPPKPDGPKPAWIDWLDQKREEGNPVLYVAFGTQAEISNEQLKELALGLEDSKVNFLWVTRRDVEEIIEGFKDRTRERGMIVRDWVNQWEILSHESVKGFLSHCGWNSAQESICIGVPLLAWPMMAEQPLNAKLIVEEIKVGLRVETQDGSLQGFVTREELSRKVKELMEGETGKILRKNVKECSKMAKSALDYETGSSWKTLDLLISKLCKSRPEPNNMSDS